MQLNKDKKFLQPKTLIFIGIILLISLPACFSLLHKGFFVTDDGEWMVIRFSAFYQTLHDGQFPVRFLQRLNFGYGYPVATFLYPGFMYFGILIHLLKIGFVDTIKVILGFSLIGTSLFTYFWLDKVFKKKSAAVVGSLVSLYLPYHLYDVYTRGSVGEVFALLWVPFTFWMIERRSIFFSSIGIFLLLISHNTIALLFLPILFLYALFKKIFSLKELLISFIFGILLSSFFVIPAVFELSYTQFSQTKISNPFSYFADINLIGISSVIIFLLSLIIFISKYKNIKDGKKIVWLFLVITFISIFFTSSFSSFLWQIIPSSFIQFPFRLLSYLVVSAAFLASFMVSETKNYVAKLLLLIILAVSIFSSYQYISPKTYTDKGEGFYATNEATTTVQDEYMPIWVKEKPLQRASLLSCSGVINTSCPGQDSKVQLFKSSGEINNLVYNNKRILFTVNTKTSGIILINTIYWPGWKIFINKQPVEINYNNSQGVMEFPIASGEYTVQAEFGETSLRILSDAISFTSFIALLIFTTRFRRNKK